MGHGSAGQGAGRQNDQHQPLVSIRSQLVLHPGDKRMHDASSDHPAVHQDTQIADTPGRSNTSTAAQQYGAFCITMNTETLNGISFCVISVSF